MSATTTQSMATESRPTPKDVEHELQSLGTIQAQGSTPQAQPSRPSSQSPTLKLLIGGVSFFCAGANDGTLGALIPYILSTFSIGTGGVSIM